MRAMILAAVLIVCCFGAGQGETNMLSNPGFEISLDDDNSWKAGGAKIQRYSDDKMEGQYSLRVYNRKKDTSGISQDLFGVKAGRGYELRADVKLLTKNESKLFQSYKAIVQFHHINATGSEVVNKYIIAWRAWITTELGWTTLVGSINAPMLDFFNTSLRIRGPDAGCDFLIDNVKLIEVAERTNWLQESLANIDQYRKSDLTIKANIPDGVPSADIDIQVRLKKHLFAFGSKVEYQVLTESQHQNFRDLFFTLFNWATIGSFKWRFDEGTLYEPDFSKAMEMLNVVEAQGLKVRAHSILWGVKDNIPDAVLSTDPSELPRLLTHHTQYMMNLTKGRVAHWDVQNELLHGHWYEETMKDPNISLKVFKEARKWDSVPKLYLNDFTAVTSGANTEDLHDTALRFKKEGTGIQGIGVQGHTKEFVKPDPTMMWKRLDRLADTGLELFMTEFDLGWDDDEERADWFEDAFRAFFAHKDLQGVILWGIWKDTQRYQNKYLIYGEDLKFAEPGNRFACLLKKEWTTNVIKNMGSGTEFTVRGFRGDYEILVKRSGTVVQQKKFSLGKNSKTITIDITEKTNAIEVTEERDYVPECISHRDRKSLGNMTSTSDRSRLSCEYVTAEQSSTATAATRLSVTCPNKRVLTGCSSYQKDRKSKMWRGEEITFANGVATCSAIVPQGGEGIKVMARCCQQTGLTCDYRRAGQSLFMKGAMAEAKCLSGYSAAGCSVYSNYTYISGASPTSDQDACRAVNGISTSDQPREQSGVVSMAACCKRSSSLSCSTVRSEASASGASDVSVTCPNKTVMTGCNVEVSSGGSAGSKMEDNSDGTPTCTAYTATDHPDSSGSVVAVAICCSK